MAAPVTRTLSPLTDCTMALPRCVFGEAVVLSVLRNRCDGFESCLRELISPGPHVLDVVVGFDETVQPVAGLTVVSARPCPINVEEGPTHRRRHLRAVAAHVDVGVLGRVA